jgi:hypothetical protein
MTIVCVDIAAQIYVAWLEVVKVPNSAWTGYGEAMAGAALMLLVVVPGNVIALILTPFAVVRFIKDQEPAALLLCLSVWVAPILVFAGILK